MTSSNSAVSNIRVTLAADLILESGVQCHKGEFAPEESELLREAVRQYQTVGYHWSTHSRPHHVYQTSQLDQEQVEDFILGEDRRQGFWEFIGMFSVSTVSLSQRRCGTARRVPGRPVASIYRHAQRLYNPYDPKDWTEAEDSRLIR